MIEVGDEFIPIVKEKMEGKCRLPDEFTLDDDIAYYLSTDHKNFFTTNGKGFLCVMNLGNHLFIPYAWREDNNYQALREMVLFAKNLYKRYTIDYKMPIYYTGLRNFYKHHSVQIDSNIWQLKV